MMPVEKVGILLKPVEIDYVNRQKGSPNFSRKAFPVEKPVDNVENSWISTGISRYSPGGGPGEVQTFPSFLRKTETAGACYGNILHREIMDRFLQKSSHFFAWCLIFPVLPAPCPENFCEKPTKMEKVSFPGEWKYWL